MTFSWTHDTRSVHRCDAHEHARPVFVDQTDSTKVVLRHGQSLIADTIRSVLSDGRFDVTVACTFDEAVALAATSDAAVIDTRLPDGCDLLRSLADSNCCRTLVALTDDDHHQIRDAYDAGAHECIMASDTFDRLVGVLADTRCPGPSHRIRRHPSTRPPMRDTPRLTSRELEVLDGLLAGESTKVLAARLQVSHATARTHVQSVLIKLGAHTRLEAVALVTTERSVVLGRQA